MDTRERRPPPLSHHHDLKPKHAEIVRKWQQMYGGEVGEEVPTVRSVETRIQRLKDAAGRNGPGGVAGGGAATGTRQPVDGGAEDAPGEDVPVEDWMTAGKKRRERAASGPARKRVKTEQQRVKREEGSPEL